MEDPKKSPDPDSRVITEYPKTCPVCHNHSFRQIKKSNIKNYSEISFCYTFSPAHSKTLDVYVCLKCSHQFCHPLPEKIWSNYVSVVDREYLKHSDSRMRSFAKALKSIKQHTNNGLLLDIGCATGDFLQVAKKQGFIAEGLEVSEWSSKIAKDRGFVIHKKFLSEFFKENENRYDVVTLWGVIEHFAEPAKELFYLNKILKKNGHLFLWTGDVASITSKVLNSKWWYWQGQHIQYFTKKSIRALLINSGFDHIKHRTFPYVLNKDNLSNSLKRYKIGKFISKFANNTIFRIIPNLSLKIPGEMFITCQKM